MKISSALKISGIILLIAVLSSCSGGKNKALMTGFHYGNPKDVIKQGKITLPVYDFDGLEPMLHISNDTTYVVNFWATWCSPCMQELPGFSRLVEEYRGQKLRVILVNLDLKSHIKSDLLPYLNKTAILPMVVSLDDPNENVWIDKVSPDWSGSIPATVIFKGNRRGFYEKSFEYAELNQLVSTYVYPQ